VLHIGTSGCTAAVILRTTLTALCAHLQVLRETGAYHLQIMLSGGFTISTICSQQFADVNRGKVKDVFSVHTVVRSITNLELYGVCISNPATIFPVLTQPGYCLVNLKSVAPLCEEMKNLLKSTTLIKIHFGVKQIKKLT
jgi:hypothetical protein